MIAEQPGHGYELMNRLEERFAGAYKASAGAVYPTLQLVEDEGLVEVQRDGGRKVFHLTADGREVVDAHQRDIDRIWARATARGEWGLLRDPDAAEIVAPALRLFKTAVGVIVRAHGDPVVVERVREVLDDARRELKEIKRDAKARRRAVRHHHHRRHHHDHHHDRERNE
ncbi:PadR family transcriptional regulator [Yinghuangia seranimata]|uniref:PadR family transcriptional regulator n=1 Tax=Yinghuangia seranimata TaxID=408067 RepID=UPI00248CF07A|nr:PadR family transcriptional regulator [Yinghuangia seranimata]MDI2130089.1 PadR family transcriptional regulator [Yinghuangia seranimata]